jgi:zinc protease
VLDRDMALSASAYYQPSAIDLGSFTVHATPKPGVAVEQLEVAIDDELQHLLAAPIDPDEVARAIARMQAAAIYARDSLSGPAHIIGTGLAIGQNLEEIEGWPERIGAVTAAEVDAAARTVLIERNSVTGILLPEPTS